MVKTRPIDHFDYTINNLNTIIANKINKKKVSSVTVKYINRFPVVRFWDIISFFNQLFFLGAFS